MNGFHLHVGRLDLLPWTLIALAVLSPLVAWLYRSRSSALKRPWSAILPALRALAIAGVLVAVIRVTASRPETSAESGKVILLVDRSSSMDMLDTPRTITGRFALADALGMTRGLVRADPDAPLRSPVAALLTMLEGVALAQSEYDYARVSGRETSGAQERLRALVSAFELDVEQLRVKVHASAPDSGIETLCNDLAGVIRMRQGEWVRATRGLFDRINESLDHLQASADESAYAGQERVRQAVDQVGAMTRLDLARTAADRAAAMIGNERRIQIESFAQANGTVGEERTDILGSIDRAMRSSPAPSAVVVFTDGRQTSGETRTATEVLPLGIPIFTVVCGQTGRRDVLVSGIAMPAAVFVNEMFDVVVSVTCPTARTERVEIGVTLDGVRQSQIVTPRDGKAQAKFTVLSGRAGIVGVIGDVDPGVIDASAANNSMTRHVKVIAEKLSVAMVAGTPTRDWENVRDSLRALPWVTLTAATLGGTSATTTRSTAAWSVTPAQIANLQALIVCDVSAASMSALQREAVRDWITTRGGALIVMAGRDAPAVDVPEWQSLMPFATPPQWRTWGGPDPAYRLVVPEGVVGVNPLVLDADPVADRRRWAAMTPLFRVATSRALKPGARSLLNERDSGAPVVTELRTGLGRVVYVGTDETRRWRSRSDGGDQEKLWLQLLRYAPEPAYLASNGDMSLDVAPVDLRPGDSVHVRARAPDSARAGLTLRRADGTLQNIAISSVDGTPSAGRYEGTIESVPAGKSALKWSSGEASVELTLEAATAHDVELREVAIDEGYAHRLADLTGGDMIRAEDLASLPRRMNAAMVRQPRMIDYPIWSSPYLFLFVAGCLCAEWAMRKQLGLT